MKNKKIIGWLCLILGLLIGFGTHFYMIYQLFASQSISNMMMLGHAIINIIGLILIVIGVALKK